MPSIATGLITFAAIAIIIAKNLNTPDEIVPEMQAIGNDPDKLKQLFTSIGE